jgi:hypothetical protein
MFGFRPDTGFTLPDIRPDTEWHWKKPEYPAKFKRQPYHVIKTSKNVLLKPLPVPYCSDVKKAYVFINYRYGKRKPWIYLMSLFYFIPILLNAWMSSWKSARISGTGIRPAPNIRYPALRLAGYMAGRISDKISIRYTHKFFTAHKTDQKIPVNGNNFQKPWNKKLN